MTRHVTFIDTNVIVYHLVQADHEHGLPSSQLFARLRAGTEAAYLSSTVVLECIHACQMRYKVPNQALADALVEILGFAGLHTDHPEAITHALMYWRTQGPLSFADCFHLALAEQLGMSSIYSFDKKMSRYPGVSRVEPSSGTTTRPGV